MSLAIARAIDTVKQVTDADDGKVRTVGATLFVDSELDRDTRKALVKRLGCSSISVLEDGRTRINL
jgi:hypothetical protein